ncbi:hypothetical protein [Bradyrhizobium sp. STM 3809]|uniref:hypothetical protein n=1 Tax=Bradyrhizobium sp. STM 3809 TaxID=551936 RepID=UPI001F0A87C3|nr:hypothetical protein [Bradyrhizobium sp. STM 3809]
MYVGSLTMWVCLAGVGRADDQRSRLNDEAERLFRVVLAEQKDLGPCELAPTWDTYPVPEYVGRKYLGLKLHASLSAPDNGAEAFQILEPPVKGSLCRADEAEELESQRLAAFKVGTEKSLVSTSRKYTFPVFSADYRTAVFVVTGQRSGWYRKSDGGLAKLAVEAAGSAVVYRKVGGSWRHVTTILLWIT